ncbi:MAG: IS21 family transposase [Candidatus Pacebacteria bacterium]|nr:IS21 family transposase [Candidatus Paceibacterota bacterium]
MRKIRQVLMYRLSKKISAEQTALALSLSKGSVINYAERFEQSKLPWPLPDTLTDTALEEALFPPLPPSKENTPNEPLLDVEYLEKELLRPHVTLQRLWEEYTEQHPDGLKRTAFYDRFARHRSPQITMKVIHKGGDKVFSDYSGDGLEYIDRRTGEIIPVDLFVCAWGASSFTFAEATETQKTLDFSMSHVRALDYFGVAPFAFVLDNTKSGVKKADRYDPVANPVYGKMADHYHVAFLPTRVCKPKDKAVVECAVLQAQRFILARLRDRQFFSLDETNAGIRKELEVLNNRPMKEYGGQSRRQRFEELDKPYAQNLPAESFKISRIKMDVRVAPNYHIRFEDHHYSVPHHFAGQCVCVYQVGPIIEIYHDNIHICRHQMGRPNFDYTTLKEHMPPSHAFVKGWSKEWFIAQADKIGPATAEMVSAIMSSREHAQQGFNAAMGVLRLAKVYTPQRVEKACQRADYFKSTSFKAIKSILEQSLDKQTFLPLPQENNPPLVHENIRGAQYYINQ